ncbi:MAG TPA: DUF433 domain-containing protein [Verrucomicrobiae bacterium]|nr:DUF433 domain-containing protein [Verrucomicrobiae bacterium]
MKSKASGKARRVELGEHIVADPLICHGKPTFKGTRIMVWQVLDALERGEPWDDIVQAWAGQVTREAIAETIRLARGALLDDHGRLSRRRAA